MPRFHRQSANAVAKGKVHQKLTEVLSRSGYDIIIIVDSEMQTDRSTTQIQLDDEYYSEAGIDQRLAKHAITLVMSTDNAAGQHQLSPWMILHQLGEAAFQSTANSSAWVWENTYKEFKEWLSQTPITRGRDDEVRAYGKDKMESAFSHLFKMKSAREFIHGGFDNYDMTQELVVEFLWHGGRIRVNYPDWIPKEIVDAIQERVTTGIRHMLDNMVGKAWINYIDG